MIFWLILKIFVFVCVALPVFGSWEKNIQIFKEINNINYFEYLIYSETMCFLFVYAFGSWENNIQRIKKIKIFYSFDYMINSEKKIVCVALPVFGSEEKNVQIIKEIEINKK